MSPSEILTHLTTTSGSDQLSAEVVCKLLAPEGAWACEYGGGWEIYAHLAGCIWPIPPEVRRCTTDLSAAVALCELRFPGADYHIIVCKGEKSVWWLTQTKRWRTTAAPTQAAALCASMIRAKEEEKS